MKKLKQQSGFSTVEIILVVLVVVLVGAVSWLAAKNSSKSSNNPTSTPTPSVSAKASSSVSPTATTAATATPKASNSLSISALGVTINNIPATLSGITYEITTRTEYNTASFSTKGLASLDKDCATNAIGGLLKINGTYVEGQSDYISVGFVKQFSGFYIAYGHPQASCSQKESVSVEQHKLVDIFEAWVTKASNYTAL